MAHLPVPGASAPAPPVAHPSRSRLAVNPLKAAPLLLGARLTHRSDDGPVTVRITEVEAYRGTEDPGSHAFRGRTARNASLHGPAGTLYVYFTYGMHYCANVVCGDDGRAGGLLLRAGEVVEGIETARARRGQPRSDLDLARGPARLAQALGLDRRFDGADLFAGPLALELPEAPVPAGDYLTGPRVGLSGPGGSAEYPWRFWLPGEPTVSKYRPAKPRAARKVMG